jgi:hypothetical protein
VRAQTSKTRKKLAALDKVIAIEWDIAARDIAHVVFVALSFTAFFLFWSGLVSFLLAFFSLSCMTALRASCLAIWNANSHMGLELEHLSNSK